MQKGSTLILTNKNQSSSSVWNFLSTTCLENLNAGKTMPFSVTHQSLCIHAMDPVMCFPLFPCKYPLSACSAYSVLSWFSNVYFKQIHSEKNFLYEMKDMDKKLPMKQF